jgi:membrane protease YdiL (CAAX protease family)
LQTIYSYAYAENFYNIRNKTALQVVIRFALWVVPVLIYIMCEKTNPFFYLKMVKNTTRGLVSGAAIGALVALYNISAVYLLKGGISINMNIERGLLIKAVILVGLSEEVLFRGFFLQKLNDMIKFKAANICTALLFVLVHISGWIMLGEFSFYSKINSILYTFVFSLIQGIVLKKTNSLWACIVIHSFNNFISLALSA